MRFLIAIEPAQCPDAVGEYLRSAFFAGQGRQKGCYETFDWQGDVHPLPDLPLAEHNHDPKQEADDYCEGCCLEDFHWTRGEKTFPQDRDTSAFFPLSIRGLSRVDWHWIECRWWWDGDGTLAFRLPDGQWLLNDDCKCSSGWRICTSEEELML